MSPTTRLAPTRRRLGVAVVLDPPVADEVDGLRRAVGDPGLARIAPHVTLVPPVNVRADAVPAALAVVRRAAAAGPDRLTLTLGPPDSFLPDNPVLYLQVGGDVASLRMLRDRVFAPPLERPLSWPWVPHVTLGDGIDPERITLAGAALDRYARVADVDRIVVLEERPGRVWQPIADARLGRPTVVGTGGLAVEITRSTLFDPEARAALGSEPTTGEELATAGEEAGPARAGAGPEAPSAIVLTARREGRPVGVARAWPAADGGHVAVLVAPAVRAQGIGSHLLAHLESAARAAGWDHPVLHATGPAGFYRARSTWSYPNAIEE
jgi:2'-5' RNA ligase